MAKPDPQPRIRGKYFVVPFGTVFPRRCIRTGKVDHLHEIDETVANPVVVSKSMGAFHYFYANEKTRLRYYLSEEAFLKLARWHRVWLWFTLAALIGAVVIAYVLRQAEAAVLPMICLSASFGAYILRPQPLNVAAVRGGEVYLLKVPREIIVAMTGEGRPKPRA